MDMSMPAASSRDFSHLAIVLEATALLGLIMARNNFVSVPRTLAVRSSYALRVVTGHRSEFDGKDG